jgi:hypothetical protein
MTWGTDAGQPDCTGGLQELRMTWFRHHALTELIVPSHDGSRDLRPQWCSRTDADGANIRRSGGDFVAPEFFPEGLSADPQNFSRLSHLAFSLTHHLRQIFALGSG